MPATFTRSTHVEPERRDTGIGGKPPVDRRPTGGGGEGDNWENRQPGRRGPRELLNRYRLAITFALAGDLMFFVALVSAFYVRQASGHIDGANNYISDWHPLAVPPILWLNTAVLLLSSLTHRNRPPPALPRDRRHGRVVRPRQTHRPPRNPLADRYRRPRNALRRRSVGRLADSSTPRASSTRPTPTAISST